MGQMFERCRDERHAMIDGMQGINETANGRKRGSFVKALATNGARNRSKFYLFCLTLAAQSDNYRGLLITTDSTQPQSVTSHNSTC